MIPRRLLRPRNCGRQAGFSIIESIVSAFIMSLVAIGVMTLMQSAITSRATITGQNSASAHSRKTLDTLADALRNAQPIPSGSTYTALTAAAASDITFPATGGKTVRYWRDSSTNTLKRAVTISGATTTATILTGVQSLTLTYYVAQGYAYSAALNNWSTTASANAPSSAELPKVGAISIAVTINIDGHTRQITSLVRLRNNPYRG